MKNRLAKSSSDYVPVLGLPAQVLLHRRFASSHFTKWKSTFSAGNGPVSISRVLGPARRRCFCRHFWLCDSFIHYSRNNYISPDLWIFLPED